MIKLSIKDIEKKLNKQVARNVYALGVDVAENFTGICLLKTDKDFITVEHLQTIVSEQKEDHFHRADHFEASLLKLKQLLEKWKGYRILIVERCFYGKNPETLIHLSQFGILAYIILKKEFDTYYYMGATTARSVISFNQKKQEEKTTIKAGTYTRDTKNKQGKTLHKKGEKKTISCKELVHDYLKTDFDVVIEDPDQADGFVLALAGLLK